MNSKIVNKILLVFLFLVLAMGKCPDDEDDVPTPPEDARDKFVGNWTCDEYSKIFGHSVFTVVISKSDTNQSQILMQNFYSIGNDEKAYANVSGYNVTIPQQTICEVKKTSKSKANKVKIGEQQLWGSGYMETSNKITWLYYADDGAEVDTVNATFTK